MNIYRQFVKTCKQHIKVTFLLLISMLLSDYSQAQRPTTGGFDQVNVTLNIVPPYSPYYADYAGANASKVFLTLQNTGERTLQIKLSGTLTGDNGLSISTKA